MARFSLPRLKKILETLDDDRNKLVIDLSCRRKEGGWFVAMDKWQTITEMEITKGQSRVHHIPVCTLILLIESISMLEPYCSEFLIHTADNEGLQKGIDEDLVSKLAEWCSIPVTYAGGGRSLDDLDLIKTRSCGRVDLTIGSALDIFGGSGVTFEECVVWNREQGT